ncbi:MAG: hypothetical protein MUP66_04120 [Candidatus Nanohaloarchaeota archaeon QJJ-5]|nr:hypothetical protein [Candidatus Nanohaloarchaeota archaeon QJJ-5]
MSVMLEELTEEEQQLLAAMMTQFRDMLEEQWPDEKSQQEKESFMREVLTQGYPKPDTYRLEEIEAKTELDDAEAVLDQLVERDGIRHEVDVTYGLPDGIDDLPTDQRVERHSLVFDPDLVEDLLEMDGPNLT